MDRDVVSDEGLKVPQRLLVVELWHIGDVVLTIPFLVQLRAIFPEAEIALLAHPHARELLNGSGLVDEFIETDLDWDAARGLNPFRYRWRELLRVVSELRRRTFSTAFQCRPHVREHVLLALSGARRRIGLAFGMSDKLLTDPIPIDDPDSQKVEQWLALLAPLGGSVMAESPALHVSEPEREWARDFIAAKGISPGEIVVGVHPGASVAVNRWPLERFMELATALASRPNVRVLNFVDPTGYGAALGGVPGVVSVKVGLRELMALTQQCAFLICNDSGPMHIAGALGVPTIAMFGWINRWLFPLGEGHELVRAARESAPRGADSRTEARYGVAEIPTSQVLEVAERKLREARAAGQGGTRQARILLSNGHR
jgi:heptosyltransferase-2